MLLQFVRNLSPPASCLTQAHRAYLLFISISSQSRHTAFGNNSTSLFTSQTLDALVIRFPRQLFTTQDCERLESVCVCVSVAGGVHCLTYATVNLPSPLAKLQNHLAPHSNAISALEPDKNRSDHLYSGAYGRQIRPKEFRSENIYSVCAAILFVSRRTNTDKTRLSDR